MTTPNPDREAELAGEPLDATDFAILNSLRAYYSETDPVPDGLVDRITFEMTLEALYREATRLTQLELADTGIRTAATEAVRTITFTSDSLTTMVTLTPHADGTVRVDGWAAPGAHVRVEVLLTDGPMETEADADGRFVFEHVPNGLAKFALHTSRGMETSTVISPTIEL